MHNGYEILFQVWFLKILTEQKNLVPFAIVSWWYLTVFPLAIDKDTVHPLDIISLDKA